MRGHSLGVFERPAIRQLSGDSCNAECVAADGNFDAGVLSAALHHAPGVRLCHRLAGKRRSLRSLGRAKQPSVLVVADSGRRDIGVQLQGERMMAGHDMMLSAFLMEAERPARASWSQILDPHF
jgi:hypothetical protein